MCTPTLRMLHLHQSSFCITLAALLRPVKSVRGCKVNRAVERALQCCRQCQYGSSKACYRNYHAHGIVHCASQPSTSIYDGCLVTCVCERCCSPPTKLLYVPRLRLEAYSTVLSRGCDVQLVYEPVVACCGCWQPVASPSVRKSPTKMQPEYSQSLQSGMALKKLFI